MRAVISTVVAALCAVTLAACTVDSTPAPVPTPEVSVTDSTPQPEATATAGPSAAVTIANVDVDGLNASVGGFVTEVSEEGGACQFVLTRQSDGTVVTVDSVGVANVTTTSCGTSQIPLDTLSKGTWAVVLHYTSPARELESEPLTMEIP